MPGNASVTAPAGLTLGYQTTDPATNKLIGTPNTPATIAGNGGVQTFLISFQATEAFSAPAMPIDFDCDGVAPAAISAGVDTVDLAMSNTPVADIIALAATPTITVSSKPRMVAWQPLPLPARMSA